MNFFFIIFISTLFIGCDLNDVNGSVSNEKVYVALQGKDQVGIVDIDSGDINLVDIDYNIVSCYSIESELEFTKCQGLEFQLNCMVSIIVIDSVFHN